MLFGHLFGLGTRYPDVSLDLVLQQSSMYIRTVTKILQAEGLELLSCTKSILGRCADVLGRVL